MYKVVWRIYKGFNTTTQLLTLIAFFTAKVTSLLTTVVPESKSHKLLHGMCMTPFETRWFVWNQNYALVSEQHFTWQSCFIYHYSSLSTKITELVVISQIKLLLQKSHVWNKNIYKNAYLSLLLKRQYRIPVAMNTNIYWIYY